MKRHPPSSGAAAKAPTVKRIAEGRALKDSRQKRPPYTVRWHSHRHRTGSWGPESRLCSCFNAAKSFIFNQATISKRSWLGAKSTVWLSPGQVIVLSHTVMSVLKYLSDEDDPLPRARALTLRDVVTAS